MKEEKQEKVSVKEPDPTEPMEPSPPPQEIPPAPAMDPRYGDKTPAFVQWLATYFPDDFKKRYAGRKVMGQRMPLNIEKTELPEIKPTAPMGSDIPEDAMAKEPKEEWK